MMSSNLFEPELSLSVSGTAGVGDDSYVIPGDDEAGQSHLQDGGSSGNPEEAGEDTIVEDFLRNLASTD